MSIFVLCPPFLVSVPLTFWLQRAARAFAIHPEGKLLRWNGTFVPDVATRRTLVGRFVLVYFLKGSLPWQGLKARNAKRKYKIIMERKQAISIQQLCQVGSPSRAFSAACCFET